MSAPRWMMTRHLPPVERTTRAMTGDAEDVDALARVWLPHVYRWCARLGGPGFDSEDAAHEVLITMCRRLPSLQDPAAFPAWLFQITRKTIANHHRRAWWKRWLPAAVVEERPALHGDPMQSYEAARAHERVWAALKELKPAHREVLVLCELEDRSASETAALLGIPEGTVKSRLRTARLLFRDLLVVADKPSASMNAGGL